MSRTASQKPLTRVAPLLAAALLLGGCEPAPPPRPNVIVLLVDTLRAQNLGAYGYGRETSPHLDALAEESFLFEQARAQAPCTFPSVNSILTGLPTSRFTGQPEGRMGIPEGAASMAEILGGAGYATAAVSASPIVRKHPSRFNPHGGFDRGFDRFVDGCVWKPASCVNERGLAEIETLPEPFFLYLHYMDPHGPFRPPEDWPLRFADPDYDGPEAILRGDPNPIAKQIAEDGTFEPGAFSREDVEHLRDLYDDEIAYFDSQLRRLLDALDARGLLESSIVVLLADHGEEFLEHGHVKHCHTLFDTEVRTPLLVRIPPEIEPTPPRRIGGLAANLDLVPTVLDYLQLEPPEPLAGRSLRGMIAGGDSDGAQRDETSGAAREAVLSSWAGLRAATDGRFKLILRLGNGETRLFDLAADPGETRDVAGAHPRDTRRLGRAISDWVRTVEAAESAEAGARQDQDAVDHLRSLGYIQ